MPYTYYDFQNPTEADFNDPAFLQAENDYSKKSTDLEQGLLNNGGVGGYLSSIIKNNPNVSQIINQWNQTGKMPAGAQQAFVAAGLPWNGGAGNGGGTMIPQSDGSWKQVGMPLASKIILGATGAAAGGIGASMLAGGGAAGAAGSGVADAASTGAPLASTTLGAGYIPAITGSTGLSSVAGLGAAGLGAAGSSVPAIDGSAATSALETGGAAGGGTLPSSALTLSNGATLSPGYMSAGLPTGASAGVGGNGSSLMSKLLGGNNNTTSINDFGKALGSFAQSQANSRGAANADTNRYNQTQISAQTARDADEAASLKKLAQTSYILGGGSKFNPGTLSLNGHTYNVNTMGLGPQPISDAQKQGATTLQSQLLQRLAPGGTVTPTPPQTTPGAAENAANYGSLITSGLGLANKMGWV